MPETDIELAVRLGGPIRQRAQDIWRRIGFSQDLGGACGICSYWLWRALNPIRPGHYTLVTGHIEMADGTCPGHSWLTLTDGTVIDLTATQFWHTVPDILVINVSEILARWYVPEIMGRRARGEFEGWWPEAQPMTYHREFIGLVRSLVKEERKKDIRKHRRK